MEKVKNFDGIFIWIKSEKHQQSQNRWAGGQGPLWMSSIRCRTYGDGVHEVPGPYPPGFKLNGRAKPRGTASIK